MLKVLKFGGTSVGTLDRIANVAQIIKKIRDEGHDVIAIVSAMSGETNKLIEYAEYYTKTPELKEMDMLLSSGERVTSALLSIALNSIGYKAISMTGREAGIMTTDTHTKAKIEKIDTQKMKFLSIILIMYILVQVPLVDAMELKQQLAISLVRKLAR